MNNKWLNLSTQTINPAHVQRAGFDADNQSVYIDLIGVSINIRAHSLDGITILRWFNLAKPSELRRLETQCAEAHYKAQLDEYTRRMDAGDLPEDTRPPTMPETRFTF
ncbi:MAG: hypothetical protein IPK58_22215 [Acidobacteria bacterium]|nr:hypothetical protein [Acidobacteriota bacterium]